MNYNYVIFATNFRYYQVMYSELNNDYARFFSGLEEVFAGKNSVILKIAKKRLFLKKALIKYLIRHANLGFVDDKKPIVFIWHKHYKAFIQEYIYYLKKVYPNCKNVFYYTDFKDLADKETFSLYKKVMDDIYIYDKKLAQKYGIQYYPEVYPMHDNKEDDLQYDLFYIGRSKDREQLINEIAQKCEEKGIKYKFIILEAKTKRDLSGIEYIDEEVSYDVIMDYISKSNCILDVTNKNIASLRVQEALSFGKKLLTNNSVIESIPEAENKIDICVIKGIDDVDWDWVKENNKDLKVGHENPFEVSRWLQYLDVRYT